jgi:hypothetical protein
VQAMVGLQADTNSGLMKQRRWSLHFSACSSFAISSRQLK